MWKITSYSTQMQDMKALIFRSGNIVFLGAKEFEAMNKAYSKLYQILMLYKQSHQGGEYKW